MTNDSVGYGFSTQDPKKTQIPQQALKKAGDDQSGRYQPHLLILQKAKHKQNNGNGKTASAQCPLRKQKQKEH